MPMTLGDAKNAALAMQKAGDAPGALAAFHHLLGQVTGDGSLRFRIADLFVEVGRIDEAVQLYRILGQHAIASGHPLWAVLAATTLATLGHPAEDLLHAVSVTYGAGSPRIARLAAAPLPIDTTQVVDAPPHGDAPFDALAGAALARALDLSHAEEPRREFPPVPFLSTLAPSDLHAVLSTLTVRRLADRALVFRQGDPGDSLYLVASGVVAVFLRTPTGDAQEVARLRENTIFGEMALLTDQPRTASVVALGPSDIIEISRNALERVAAQSPAVAVQLDRFARERLIKNLLATSPLFTPFSPQQQADLLQRFEGIEYAAGATVIQQGQPGTGLFVVLSGAVEVVSQNAQGAAVTLARLHCGDVFGEMSLLTSQPTNATVRAVAPCTLLFLHRDYLWRLVATIDEIRDYFDRLVAQRAQHADLALGRRGMAAPDATPIAAREGGSGDTAPFI